MNQKVPVPRFMLLGLCIGLAVALLALLYLAVKLSRDERRVVVQAPEGEITSYGQALFIPDGLRVFLESQGYVTLALVKGDGSVKFAKVDGEPQSPCFVNGGIIGIGECEQDGITGYADLPVEGDTSGEGAPRAVVLTYMPFCKRVLEGGTYVRKHNTDDPTPNTEAKWNKGNKPCNDIEETANYRVHSH